MTLPDTVSGTILAIDVERFGDPHRDNRSGFRVIEAFYRVLREAFAESSVPWEQCAPEDRGDGALVFVPATFATIQLIDPFFGWLTAALAGHNRAAALGERFRLRIAVHRGDALRTEHGHTGDAVVLACRLLDAAPLRTALGGAPTDLAVIVSEAVYDTVVRHGYRGIDPSAYHPVSVKVKRTRARAWVHLPDSTQPPLIEPDPLAEPEYPVATAPGGGSEARSGGGVNVTGTATGSRSVGVRIDRFEWR